MTCRCRSRQPALMTCITLFGLAAITGCGPAPSREDLYGSYLAVAKNSSETLILRPDGTFRQIYVDMGGNIVDHSGTWSYDPTGPDVTLKNVYIHHWSSAISPEKTAWGLPVKSTRRGLWLGHDEGVWFRRMGRTP